MGYFIIFVVLMVASFIISYQHECGVAMFAAHAVVEHRAVATAVAEREYRLFTNLFGNLQHLVGLQVLDDELVGTGQVLFTSHGVVDASFLTLTA